MFSPREGRKVIFIAWDLNHLTDCCCLCSPPQFYDGNHQVIRRSLESAQIMSLSLWRLCNRTCQAHTIWDQTKDQPTYSYSSSLHGVFFENQEKNLKVINMTVYQYVGASSRVMLLIVSEYLQSFHNDNPTPPGISLANTQTGSDFLGWSTFVQKRLWEIIIAGWTDRRLEDVPPIIIYESKIRSPNWCWLFVRLYFWLILFLILSGQISEVSGPLMVYSCHNWQWNLRCLTCQYPGYTQSTVSPPLLGHTLDTDINHYTQALPRPMYNSGEEHIVQL